MKKILLFAGILLLIIAIYFFGFSNERTLSSRVPRNFISNLKVSTIISLKESDGPFGITVSNDSLVLYTENGTFVMDENEKNSNRVNIPGNLFFYTWTANDTAWFDDDKNLMVFASGSSLIKKQIKGIPNRAFFHNGAFYYDVKNFNDLKNPQAKIYRWDPKTGKEIQIADLIKLFEKEIRGSDTLCLMKTLEGNFFESKRGPGFIFYYGGYGVLLSGQSPSKFRTIDSKPFFKVKEKRFSLGDGRLASTCEGENEFMVNYQAVNWNDKIMVLSGAIGLVDSSFYTVDLYNEDNLKYNGSYVFEQKSSDIYPISIAVKRNELFVLFNNATIQKYILP